MSFLASMPLQQALGLTLIVTAGMLLFVGWVFWNVNPPKF